MKATHQVLGYTPDEGQGCFTGTEQECHAFIQQQGDATFMYEVVPLVGKSTIPDKKTIEAEKIFNWLDLAARDYDPYEYGLPEIIKESFINFYKQLQ